MASAVLTVEADGKKKIQNFVVGLLLPRDHGFIPSPIERLYVVLLQFDLENLIEVKNGFVRVADLEIPVDHRCDLPSREIAFRTSKFCLQLCPGDSMRRLQTSNRLRGFNLVDPYHCFNRKTCTRGHFGLSPLVLAPPQEH